MSEEILITKEQLIKIQGDKAAEMVTEVFNMLKKEMPGEILNFLPMQKILIESIAIHSRMVNEELFNESEKEPKC